MPRKKANASRPPTTTTASLHVPPTTLPHDTPSDEAAAVAGQFSKLNVEPQRVSAGEVKLHITPASPGSFGVPPSATSDVAAQTELPTRPCTDWKGESTKRQVSMYAPGFVEKMELMRKTPKFKGSLAQAQRAAPRVPKASVEAGIILTAASEVMDTIIAECLAGNDGLIGREHEAYVLQAQLIKVITDATVTQIDAKEIMRHMRQTSVTDEQITNVKLDNAYARAQSLEVIPLLRNAYFAKLTDAALEMPPAQKNIRVAQAFTVLNIFGAMPEDRPAILPWEKMRESDASFVKNFSRGLMISLKNGLRFTWLVEEARPRFSSREEAQKDVRETIVMEVLKTMLTQEEVDMVGLLGRQFQQRQQ